MIVVIGVKAMNFPSITSFRRRLEWALRPRRPAASGGEQVDWNIQLKQYVV